MAGIFTLKHGSIIGKDATGTPIDVDLAPGPGNMSIQGMEAGMVEGLPVYNRGTFYELVEGSQKGISFSIEVLQEGKFAADGSTNRPGDLVLKAGTFASGTTTDPGGQVWAVDIVLTMTRNAVTSICTLKNCRVLVDFSEDANGNKVSISGTAYGTGSTLPVVWS
jgi:hypothetical protein